MLKKVLKNNKKTKAYLESLPKLYLVVQWAKYGIAEHYFTGKYTNIDGISVPLVYDYDDYNGTSDNWYLRRIDHTTTGNIFMWTQSKAVAEKVAELMRADRERYLEELRGSF